MNLQEFLEEVGCRESDIIVYDTPEDALEAVICNAFALQYVKDQTEEICLEAVKRYGDALQYVTLPFNTSKTKPKKFALKR